MLQIQIQIYNQKLYLDLFKNLNENMKIDKKYFYLFKNQIIVIKNYQTT